MAASKPRFTSILRPPANLTTNPPPALAELPLAALISTANNRSPALLPRSWARCFLRGRSRVLREILECPHNLLRGMPLVAIRHKSAEFFPRPLFRRGYVRLIIIAAFHHGLCGSTRWGCSDAYTSTGARSRAGNHGRP